MKCFTFICQPHNSGSWVLEINEQFEKGHAPKLLSVLFNSTHYIKLNT